MVGDLSVLRPKVTRDTHVCSITTALPIMLARHFCNTLNWTILGSGWCLGIRHQEPALICNYCTALISCSVELRGVHADPLVGNKNHNLASDSVKVIEIPFNQH